MKVSFFRTILCCRNMVKVVFHCSLLRAPRDSGQVIMLDILWGKLCSVKNTYVLICGLKPKYHALSAESLNDDSWSAIFSHLFYLKKQINTSFSEKLHQLRSLKVINSQSHTIITAVWEVNSARIPVLN